MSLWATVGVYFSKDIHSQEEKKNQKKAVNVMFYIYIMTKLKKLTWEQTSDILDCLNLKSNTDLKLLDHVQWLQPSEGI